MKGIYYILVVSIVLSACSSGSVPSSSDEQYVEDLSVHRPEIPESKEEDSTVSKTPDNERNITAFIEPQYDVTKDLDAVLDSIDRLRSDINFIDGFTIMVYSGTSSEKARIVKGKVVSALPESEPVLKYDEPSFRVKVGKYYSRIEAQQDYSMLKEEFPKAIIIPERIPIDND